VFLFAVNLSFACGSGIVSTDQPGSFDDDEVVLAGTSLFQDTSNFVDCSNITLDSVSITLEALPLTCYACIYDALVTQLDSLSLKFS